MPIRILLAILAAKWFLDSAEDQARQVSKEFIKSGRQSAGTTLKIRHAIEQILKRHRYAKVGKSVIPDKRLKATDYHKYQTMYLVYKTESKDSICYYENYFINAFWDQLDNKHEVSNGREAKIKQHYYLYVVVAD